MISTSRWWCGNEKEKLAEKREDTAVFQVVWPSSGVISYVHFKVLFDYLEFQYTIYQPLLLFRPFLYIVME